MKVNGVVINLEKKQTLFDFLEAQNYNIMLIAVEHNGIIVPKETYKHIILCAEDNLEVVHFVGGG